MTPVIAVAALGLDFPPFNISKDRIGEHGGEGLAMRTIHWDTIPDFATISKESGKQEGRMTIDESTPSVIPVGKRSPLRNFLAQCRWALWIVAAVWVPVASCDSSSSTDYPAVYEIGVAMHGTTLKGSFGSARTFSDYPLSHGTRILILGPEGSLAGSGIDAGDIILDISEPSEFSVPCIRPRSYFNAEVYTQANIPNETVQIANLLAGSRQDVSNWCLLVLRDGMRVAVPYHGFAGKRRDPGYIPSNQALEKRPDYTGYADFHDPYFTYISDLFTFSHGTYSIPKTIDMMFRKTSGWEYEQAVDAMKQDANWDVYTVNKEGRLQSAKISRLRYMRRDPSKMRLVTEDMTSKLKACVLAPRAGSTEGSYAVDYSDVLQTMADFIDRIDVSLVDCLDTASVKSPDAVKAYVHDAIVQAYRLREKAFEGLSENERAHLIHNAGRFMRNLYVNDVGMDDVGANNITFQWSDNPDAVIPDKALVLENIAYVDLLNRVRLGSLIESALCLTCLTTPVFAGRVRDIYEKEPTKMSTMQGVSGKIKEAVEIPLTSAEGRDAAFFFVVGADGEAVYYEGDRILENATREHVLGTVLYGASADDTYRGAAKVIPSDDGQSSSSLNVIYDFGGNDAYLTASARPVPAYNEMQFDTGGVAFGVSVLVDASGNDVYENGSFTQAAALGGVSLLINLGGNDRYRVVRDSVDGTVLDYGAVNQGVALWGAAALIDINGADMYRSGYMGQGLGGPAGIGILMDHNADVAGPDRYQLGGLLKEVEYTHVDRSRGYGQGLGLGLRYKYPGGVGILVDHGPGEDSFAGGTFSMGVGLIYGLGILHNSGSPNDREGVYGDDYAPLRYGLGSAAHFSVGVMLDDAGDDVYAVNREFQHSGYIALCGFGWDLSYGLMMDKQGDDGYFREKRPSASIGNGAQTGLGLFFDNGGSDYYNQHFTRETNFYHGGYSLGIAIDARQAPSEQDVFTDSRYEQAPSERMLVTQTPTKRLDEKEDNSSITERLLFVQLLAGIEEPHNTPSVFKEID